MIIFLFGSPLPKDEGYPPVTAQIYIDGKQIIMEYHEAMREQGIKQLRHELKDGEKHKLGNVFIEVKTSANKSYNQLQKLSE